MGPPTDETQVDRARPTRLVARDPAAVVAKSAPAAERCAWQERLALFACSMNRDSAIDLLEGLADPERVRARAYARRVVGWDSPTRQARLAVEFGLRGDSEHRLHALMAEASPQLRLEVFSLLPPYHRTLFPDVAARFSARGAPPSPAVSALAQRMVREATR